MCIRHLQLFFCSTDLKNPHPEPGEPAARGGSRPDCTVHSEDEASGRPVHRIETWTRCAHPRAGHLCASHDRHLELTLEWYDYQCPACHPRDRHVEEQTPVGRRVDRLLEGGLPFKPDAKPEQLDALLDRTPAVWRLEGGGRLSSARLRKDLSIFAESYVDALLILVHKIFVLDRHRRSSGKAHPIIDWSDQDLAEIAMYIRAETLCGRAAGTCGEDRDKSESEDKNLDSDVDMDADYDGPLSTSKLTRQTAWRPAVRSQHEKHGHEHLGNAAAGWRSRAAAEVLASCKAGSLRDLQFPAQTGMLYQRAVVRSGGLRRWRRMALVRSRVDAEYAHLQELTQESGPSAWDAQVDVDGGAPVPATQQQPKLSTEERLAARFKLARWVSVLASFDPGLSDDAAVLVGEYAAQILNPWPCAGYLTASLVQTPGTLLEKLIPVPLFAEKKPRPTSAMRRAVAEAERARQPGTINLSDDRAPYPPLRWYHRSIFQLELMDEAGQKRQDQLTATTNACFRELYAHRLSPGQLAEILDDERGRWCEGCGEEYGRERRPAVRLPCCGRLRCEYCWLKLVVERHDARIGGATTCPLCPYCDAPMTGWFAPVEESKTTKELIGSVLEPLEESRGLGRCEDGVMMEG